MIARTLCQEASVWVEIADAMGIGYYRDLPEAGGHAADEGGDAPEEEQQFPRCKNVMTWWHNA
eukprot:8848120-Lingulodinium_polyedra.AAC.1